MKFKCLWDGAWWMYGEKIMVSIKHIAVEQCSHKSLYALIISTQAECKIHGKWMKDFDHKWIHGPLHPKKNSIECIK